MQPVFRQRFLCTLTLAVASVIHAGCAHDRRHEVELGEIYNRNARLPDHVRNPVIVIPGILGSRLVDSKSGNVSWGEIGPGTSSPLKTSTLRELALPMQAGASLSQLRDQVHEDGPLDQLKFKLFGVPIGVNAYAQILAALGVGGYRDRPFRRRASFEEVDYGDDHFTCFQFSYDWRRDISETAGELHKFIEGVDAFNRQMYLKKYGIEDPELRYDIVAHSMGGLLTRYYLRYGNQPLPEDGSQPELNWAGANRVGRAFLIAAPNSGSTLAVTELQNGVRLAKPLPKFPAAVVGTMPAAYQLLPRTADQPLLSENGQALDVLDPCVWERFKWGLADPRQDRTLKKLMPNRNKQQRRRIALDHQFKCLVRARQFHKSLDVIATPPENLELHLYAGDAMKTLDAIVVDEEGSMVEEKMAAGDETVTRTSALSRERSIEDQPPRIHWDSWMFLSADHIGLTRDRAFVDNVLSRLFDRNMIPLAPVATDAEVGISELIETETAETFPEVRGLFEAFHEESAVVLDSADGQKSPRTASKAARD